VSEHSTAVGSWASGGVVVMTGLEPCVILSDELTPRKQKLIMVGDGASLNREHIATDHGAGVRWR